MKVKGPLSDPDKVSPLPLCADTLSKRLLEHLEALQACFSSKWGHWRPPLDSGLRTSRVRTEVPLPQATLHLDHSLHSLTWQSMTEIRYALMGNGKDAERLITSLSIQCRQTDCLRGRGNGKAVLLWHFSFGWGVSANVSLAAKCMHRSLAIYSCIALATCTLRSRYNLWYWSSLTFLAKTKFVDITMLSVPLQFDEIFPINEIDQKRS